MLSLRGTTFVEAAGDSIQPELGAARLKGHS